MLEILVYGAKERCASCVNAPSSIETATWLQAALSRVYAREEFNVRFVDIHAPQSEQERRMAQRVLEEDLWHPVVAINDRVISEGNPDLKLIYKELNALGLRKNE